VRPCWTSNRWWTPLLSRHRKQPTPKAEVPLPRGVCVCGDGRDAEPGFDQNACIPGRRLRRSRRDGRIALRRDGRNPSLLVIQSRRRVVGRAPLDAMAWARRRIQERGRRAKLDPRGCFQRRGIQVRRPFVGRAMARRGVGLGTTTYPGAQASSEARPTGVVSSPEASSRAGPSWVERRSTRRWLGHLGESSNGGVGRSPTHGGCFQPRGIQSRRPFVGRAPLDAAMAWAPRRIQERGRRAEPDPRVLFLAPRHPVAQALRGSSTTRRGDGLGTSANPGTRASGGARPTGVVFSPEASSRESPSWVEHRSTR